MSLGYLRSWLNRPPSSRRRPRLATRKGMGVEQLEERQLLATTPTTLLLDFGTATSPVAEEHTPVTRVKYSATRGFGWQSTSGLTAINRNTSDPLTQDFHRGKNNTFLADVPNGTYQVTAVLGDASSPLDRVRIVAEGHTVASGLSATAGRTVTSTFQVNVTDGRLNLQFVDRGGRNPYFSLAALNISAVDSTPAAPTADAGTDGFAYEGDTVTFNGSATGSSGLSYLWDFGDGTTQTGTLTPTHTYRDSGLYTISLTVTDAFGQSAADTSTLLLMNVAPSVTLDGPSKAMVGTPVQFLPQVTDPGQADVDAGFYYFWDFGDGGSSSEANPEHTFAAPGTYTVSVTALDKEGKFSTATTAVQVDGTTPGLSVNAGSDQNSQEGTAVSFNGTTSGSVGGLSYLWDFGDGSSASDTLTPSHVYQDSGSYTVTLTVTDAAGESRSDTAAVTIANAAPTALPGGPYAGSPGAAVAFGGNATDASEADTQAGFTYRWDFGDGTTSTQRNPSKVYAAAGTYTVQLTVTDKDGDSTTAQTTAAISATPVPLSANAGPDRSGNEGALLSFNGTASGGTGPLSYLWDFGDGSGADTLTASHTYRDNGSYTVTLRVTDAAGQSRSDTAQVTVGNMAPSASVGGPYSGTAGQTVAFAGSATDPGADDASAGFTYSWSFGDGSTGSGANPIHAYGVRGNYTVTLTVTDKDGGTATATTTASVTDPTQPAPTGDFIVTAFDRIPNFGANPTITSARSGDWSDPGTWSLGRVPVAGDIVSITGGKTVAYDVVSDAAIKTVAIQSGAQLNFRTDINTRLTVTNFLVMEGGTLQIGTATNPVAASVKAEVIFTDTPLDTVNDPEQYGNGLSALGKVAMHGAAKSETFVRLAVEPKAGDTTLTLAEPVSGWRVGDRLVLPDTRQIDYVALANNYTWQGETLTVAALSADGRTVTLTAPLAYDHRGAYTTSGDLTFLPHVGNLTRNVVFRSESAAGVRGHAAFLDKADVDIRYASFVGMGRTTNEWIDPTTFDEAGRVTHVGTNQPGRYSVQFRHMQGPPLQFVGNSVFCPMQEHLFKWGIALLDTHYGLVQGNVLYNWAGSALVLESGNETGNAIDSNFVVRFRGGHGSNHETSGAGIAGGIWAKGFNNRLTNNVIANGGVNNAGIVYFGKYVSEVLVPAGPGQAPSLRVDMNATPILEDRGNEVYGAIQTGLSLWWLGDNGFVPHPGMAPSTITDLKIWHHTWEGVYLYQTTNLTLDGTVIRGDPRSLADSAMGFYGTDYTSTDITVRRADVQGLQGGYLCPTNTFGVLRIEDSYFDCRIDVAVAAMQTGHHQSEFFQPRRLEMRNVRYGEAMPGKGAHIQMPYSDQNVVALVVPTTILVSQHNGVVGDDFQVFYNEQAPDYIVPETILNPDGTKMRWGAPEAGLTNQQLWAKYQLAIAGAVATNATTRAGIDGLVRDL